MRRSRPESMAFVAGQIRAFGKDGFPIRRAPRRASGMGKIEVDVATWRTRLEAAVTPEGAVVVTVTRDGVRLRSACVRVVAEREG